VQRHHSKYKSKHFISRDFKITKVGHQEEVQIEARIKFLEREQDYLNATINFLLERRKRDTIQRWEELVAAGKYFQGTTAKDRSSSQWEDP
jgi:hypothetical protein